MLSIQGIMRRELLTVGGVGLLGLSLPDVLRHEAAAQPGPLRGSARQDGFGRRSR